MGNAGDVLLPPQPSQGISSDIGYMDCERRYGGDFAESVLGWLQSLSGTLNYFKQQLEDSLSQYTKELSPTIHMSGRDALAVTEQAARWIMTSVNH